MKRKESLGILPLRLKQPSLSYLQLCYRTLAAICIVAMAAAAPAQIPVLDKGHQLLVNSGLQIWGLDSDTQYNLDYNELTAGNMTGVMFGTNYAPDQLSAGQKWGFWADYHGTPATALNAAGVAHQADLVAIQVGDEQQGDIENPSGYTQAWFNAAHTGNYFPNQLLYTNSFFIGNGTNYTNFIANANPDAISWDSYPFSNPHGYYIQPTNWLALGNIFRRYALGTYIGATSTTPRPYGMWLQTYHDTYAVDPGEVEIRWQQFAAWTMGYKFVDAFIYTGGNNNFAGHPDGVVYKSFQETARQGRNLSPALSKLISYGYGPSFVAGAGSSGIPGEWISFARNNAQPSQRYLTAITNVTNLGTKNGGLSGDVYVGFFNPLHLGFGDPTGTTYFMVMNGLGGDLSLPNGQSDNTATVAETRQQMTLNLDFGITGINSLLRLNRNTGLVDVIDTNFSDGGNTVLASLGSGKYQLQLKLDGGTGDLFKYNDGTPFVGVQQAPALGYWDADGNAGGNDPAGGAGLGGTGNWDSASTKWYNGTSTAAYSAGSNVVFAGTAGTVTLTSPQSVTSLEFKSSGYTIAGSIVTLNAPTITVGDGATATISSTLAGSSGLIKNGPGTLNLASAATYTGNTTINEGILSISTGSLGTAPGSPTPNIQINNGATLRFNAGGITLGSTRQIVLSADGGVFDTNGNDATIAGSISGGALTKTGAGALALTATNSFSSLTIAGGALVVSSNASLGSTPSSFTAGNTTLDGGSLRFGGNFDLSNNRGITLGAGGGTIDTNGFTNPSGYIGPGSGTMAGGFTGAGDLTKLGAGTFFAAATTGGANTTWKGKLIIKEGTWKIVATDGLPFNPTTNDGLQPAQVTLDGGTWQIGASVSATNARRGITVAAGGGTIDTQGFNLTWPGPLAGSSTNAVLNKIGGGMLRLNSTVDFGPATYSGTFNINEGLLQLDGGTAMGDNATINLANVAGVSLLVSSGNETIGALSGGGTTGGNVTVNSGTRLTTGANNVSTIFSGQIMGAGGALTKTGSGTFTLARSAGSSYSGGTTVSGGTLLVTNFNGSATGSGTVTVNSGATLGGAGFITGAVTNNGIVAPGASTGTLSLGNTYTQGAAGKLQIELASAASFDHLAVTSTASLAGTLEVLLSGYTPTAGDAFQFLTASTVNGTFGTTTLPALPANLVWYLSYASNSITLAVNLAGDFNRDGAVNAADFVTWRKAGGTTTDYNTWRANFGASVSGGGSNAANNAGGVPEPASAVLIIFALVFVCVGRRL